FAEALAPAVELVDRRILGSWSGRGADEHLQHWRSWLQLVDVAIRFNDVLGLRPDALLCRLTFFGTDRAGGGAWEIQTLEILVFGADGLLTRIEVFDPDREAEALARFDALVPSRAEAPTAASSGARIENAATRFGDHMRETWEALDLERFAALLAPGFRNVDRRRILQTDLDRDQFLESFRPIFASASRLDLASELLATRGDRLALYRMCNAVVLSAPLFDVPVAGCGPVEVPFLQILEVDTLGRYVAGFGV